MALHPRARLRLLPENRTQPRIHATQVIYHSIVGSAAGAYGYFLNSTNLESHFIVTKSGNIWQLIDTARSADANYRANVRAISIETEDNGRPDSDPWTKAQIDALIDIGTWAAKVHNIPKRICPRWDLPGFGYHVLFGSPGNWTPSAKTCPGKVRITQVKQTIFPAIFSGTTVEEDVVTSDDRKAIANEVVSQLTRNDDFINAIAKRVLFDTRNKLHQYWDAGEEKEGAETLNFWTLGARGAQAADEARDTIVGPVLEYLTRIENKLNLVSGLATPPNLNQTLAVDEDGLAVGGVVNRPTPEPDPNG